MGLQRSDAKGGTNNWQSLDKVKWLQHVITGEYVVVAGTAKHFLDTVSSGRPDMGFNLRTFQQLLANKLKTRRVGEVRETYKDWKLVSEPSMIRSLPDGTSLRNIMGVSPAAATAVPPLAQMSHEAVPVPSAAATQLLPGSQAMNPMAWAQPRCAGACGCCKGPRSTASIGAAFGAAEVADAMTAAVQATAQTYESVLEHEREQAQQRVAHLNAEVRT